MSHEIETIAWANQVPWHGLGNQVPADVSVDEMLVAAGLDWEVGLYPMQAVFDNDELVTVERRYALLRKTDKKVMTICGEHWHPLQNKDMMEFWRAWVDAKLCTLETAGSLRDGKLVWALAKLNHSYVLHSNDRVEGYLLFTSPHEIGQSIRTAATAIRVVCANTMRLAEQNMEILYRQGHAREFDMDAAKQAVEAAHEDLVSAEKRARQIAKLKINAEDTLRKVYVPVMEPAMLAENADEETKLALENILDPQYQSRRLFELMDSYNNAPGAEPGTGWGALNGFTHWADHVSGRDQSTRLVRSWMGDNANKKLEVERRLLELC